MKIIFIGGVKFSHDLLLHVITQGWQISTVFSYDDSKQKFYSDFTTFDEITKKFGIKHVKVNNINDSENIEILRKINPDLILVMGWSQLLKTEIIKIPKFGVIGSHPTELPKYRGRAPIPWSIIKGLKENALTFFYIQDGIDDGDILDQQKFKISEMDDATSLYDKITELGKKMLIHNLSIIEKGTTKRTKQDPRRFIEYWPKRTPDDGKINWSKPAKEIHTLIRASAYPYPGAFSYLENNKLIIWKASYSNEKSKGIGKIMHVGPEGIKIGTGLGCLIIKNGNFYEQKKQSLKEIISKDKIGKILGV